MSLRSEDHEVLDLRDTKSQGRRAVTAPTAETIPLLDAIPSIRGRRGRPRRKPDAVVADRGYDHDKYRLLLRQRDIRPLISRHGTRDNNQPVRWVVEQTLALLHQFRRLAERWERRTDIHHGYGTIVQLWDCNNTPQQTWRVEYDSSDEIYLVNSLNNRCLDGDLNFIDENGAKVQLWDCNYEDQQRWQIYVVSEEERSFILGNQAASDYQVMDADTNTMNQNGTKIQLWEQNDEIQQIFIWNRY